MRIAFIAPFGLQLKGTVSARMLPLAHALANRGHLVRIVIPPWDDPSAQISRGSHVSSSISTIQEGKVSGSGVHIVTLSLPRIAPYSFALTYGLVQEALTTFRAEVVHVFKPIGYSGLAGLVFAAMGVPWVLDTDDWEGPGGWADANPYSRTQKLVAAVQDAILPRLAPAVTSASRTLEARAWGFGLPRHRVFYLPNGVWSGKYDNWVAQPVEVAQLSRQYGLEGKRVVLLYTRFAEFPYGWSLEVLQRLVEKHPDVTLLVVGSGFFGEEEKMRVEAAQRGIGEHVIVVGHVLEERLPAYLALGDVALYPMEDTLLNRAKSPVKVLEPMVMGLPVVAHGVGEVVEFVGDAGMLVQPGDLHGMAEGVSALLADTAQRESLGRRARERVWACFNWERLCLTAEEAYGLATSLSLHHQYGRPGVASSK